MKTLKTLTQLPGIPGHESRVKAFLKETIEPLSTSIIEDNLGSLVGVKGNTGPKIMIASHMDEIGLIVSAITKEGFLKFQTVGGWFSQVMLAQLWDIHTEKGVIIGVTGTKPPHIIPMSERSKAIEIDSMFIDIGVSSKEEALEKGVRLGQMITPHNDFFEMANSDYMLAKAFDNRVGTYIVTELLKEVNPSVSTFYGGFTVQEEVGLRGAKTSAYMVNPDIAISIDTGVGHDTPGGDPQEQTLGKGPQIYLFDRTTIGHPNLRAFIKKVAEDNDIPYQEPFIKRGGTDAGNMHLAHDGAPAVSIGIPTRYMHSHYGIIHKKDVENTIKLLKLVVEKLDDKALKSIKF